MNSLMNHHSTNPLKMKFTVAVAVAVAVLLGGCVRFQHQTGPSEPHGLVIVINHSDFQGDYGMVKSLDGLPVRRGRPYRVKPGEHDVIVRNVETVTWVIEGDESAGVAPQAVIRQLPVLTTNKIRIQAGGQYELEGVVVRQRNHEVPRF